VSGLKDAGLAFSSNIGVTLVAVGTQSCLAWFLGPEARGSYAVCLIFGSLLGAIFAVGLDAAIQYYVAAKKIAISDALSVAFFLVLAGGLCAALFGLMLMELDLEYFDKADSDSFEIALFYIPISMLVGFLPRLMVGLRDFVGMGLYSIVQAIVQLIVIFVAIGVLELGINGALTAMVLSGVITIVLELLYLRKKYKFEFIKPNVAHIKMVVHYGMRHHFARLSNIVNFQMGAIILAFFATREEIGYFTVASALMGYVVQIPGALGKALLPRVAGDENGQAALVALSSRMSGVICGLIIVVILLIREPLINIIFSPSFSAVIPLLVLLAPGMFVRSISKVMVPYFNGMAKPQITSYAVVSGILVNISTLFILYPIMGLEGAAISMTTGYFVSSVISLYYFSKLSGQSYTGILIPSKSDWEYVSTSFNKLKLKLTNNKKI